MEVLGAVLCRSIQKRRVLLPAQVICWSIYCGDDVDFGNGPRIFIDNMDEDSTSNYLSGSRLCWLKSTLLIVLFCFSTDCQCIASYQNRSLACLS